MNNFTPEDMIRFLYNEMTADEKSALQLALDADWTLREKFEVLKRAVLSLDTLKYSPRSESIDAIMQYAGNVKVEQH